MVSVELCYENGCNLLVFVVMCNYYSNFTEVAHLKSTTSSSVIREMKEVFARFGVPDMLVSDNTPQFSLAARVCGVRDNVGIRARHIIPALPTVKSRKCGGNNQETVRQML